MEDNTLLIILKNILIDWNKKYSQLFPMRIVA